MFVRLAMSFNLLSKHLLVGPIKMINSLVLLEESIMRLSRDRFIEGRPDVLILKICSNESNLFIHFIRHIIKHSIHVSKRSP